MPATPRPCGLPSAPGDTRLVWIETPSNPLWTITDIAEVARIAHAAGALLAVDFDGAHARAQPADRRSVPTWCCTRPPST